MDQRLWDLKDNLSQVVIYRDWDYVSSSFAGLRSYLYDYHAIPAWDFMLCAGKPDLANPQGHAFTWVSLYAYLFNPNVAIFVLWLSMTLVGLLAMQALLRRWTKSAMASWAGAILFTFNGYFSSHFNQGHITFSMFHLVPLMMLLALRCFEASGSARVREMALSSGVAWLFFTGALPHPLLVFYPAFLLFFCYLVLSQASRTGWKDSLRRGSDVALSHIFAMLMATYKLFPVIAWQHLHPRAMQVHEQQSPLAILGNFLHFVPNFDDPTSLYYPGQVWGSWEYNAYTGTIPWVVAGLFVIFWCLSRLRERAQTPSAPSKELTFTSTWVVGLAIVYVIVGFIIAQGNVGPFAPGRYFTRLRLFSGIHVFARYEVLILLGLSLLASFGLAWMESLFKNRHLRLIATTLVASGLCLGGIFQTAALIRNIDAYPFRTLEKAYGLPVTETSTYILGMIQPNGSSTQTYLMHRGYWPASCYEPMNLTRLKGKPGSFFAVSNPPPKSLMSLSSNEMLLSFSPTLSQMVTLNLPVTADYHFNKPVNILADGQAQFRAEDLRGQSLTIKVDVPGAKSGLALSFVAFVGWLAMLGYRRKCNSAANSASAIDRHVID